MKAAIEATLRNVPTYVLLALPTFAVAVYAAGRLLAVLRDAGLPQ